MKVKNWMHPDPIVVERDTLLQKAVEIMLKHSIRHLPVMEGEELVGFVTQNDLRQYFFPAMVEDIPVHEVMIINPLTVNVNSSIEKAAKLIHDFKIGGLPVMDKKKLVGVITSSDIVSGFIEVMGLLKSSTRLDVIADKESGVEDVTRIIKSHNLEIMSVASENQPSRRKVYFFRLGKGDVGPAVRELEKAGHKVLSVMD